MPAMDMTTCHGYDDTVQDEVIHIHRSMNRLNRNTAGSWSSALSLKVGPSRNFCATTNVILMRKVQVPRLSPHMAVTVYGRLVMGVVPRWALVTRAMRIAEINVDKR